MTRFAPRFFRSSLGLVAALGVSANAYAVAPRDLPEPSGECLEDVDCGHGFECQSSITSAIAGAGGIGGTGGTAGAAGTGTAGTASGGASAAPRPSQQCGNQLCELPESPTTCPSDCVVYRYCSLAECDTTEDCAEGYLCEGTGSVGTGGGPSAPVCGDGVCNGAPESETTCPQDCASRSFCTPESGHCTSDGDCATGFYCSFYGSGSGSGGSGVGGSPGTGGFANPGGSAGANSGGTAGRAEGGYAGAPDAPDAEEPPGDTALALGTCMPGGGVGGSPGTGGDGSGGISTGGIGSGGVSSGGTGAIGSGAVSGTGGSSEGGGSGGTGSGEPGTGARTGGGTTSNGGSGTTTGSGGNGGSKPNDDVVVSRGCSVADGAQPSGFGSLLFAALAFVGLRRRRASV